MNTPSPSQLIAIVGGSGAGKTWFADELQRVLDGALARLALDDFYRDRSDLSPAARERINFDDPRAIDWPCFEQVLRDCRDGRAVRVPRYDFLTHTRLPELESWQPRPLVLVDGLWLLQRHEIRKLFQLKIFIECPWMLRLRRRFARDTRERGRGCVSVLRQFHSTVAPMHKRHVAPQIAWADVVLRQPVTHVTVSKLADRLRSLLMADINVGSLAGAPKTAREEPSTTQAALISTAAPVGLTSTMSGL